MLKNDIPSQVTQDKLPNVCKTFFFLTRYKKNHLNSSFIFSIERNKLSTRYINKKENTYLYFDRNFDKAANKKNKTTLQTETDT